MMRVSQILRVGVVLFSLCLAMLLPSTGAHAASLDLSPCFRAAQPGETINQLLAKRPVFGCKSQQALLQPGSYWVQLQIPRGAHTVEGDMVFRTASLWDEGMELWVIHANGQIAHYQPYRDQDISPLRLGGTVVVPLDRNNLPLETIIVKVSGSAAMRGVLHQSQLTNAEDAISYEMALAVLYAAFGGIALALLVYNIALWRGMRERFLLAYCSMLIVTLCYAFFTSGAPHYIWPEMTGPDRLRLTIPLLAMTAASAMVFIRHFFDSDTIPKWLSRLTYAYALWISLFAVFYAAMAPMHVKLFDLIYVYGFIPVPILGGCYVCIAFKKQDPFLVYFLAAWAGPAVSVAVRLAYGLDFLTYNIVIENSTLAAMAWEALVSSLAIGRRVRLLAQSRDRAEIAEAQAMAMADADPLTGMMNRRAFVRELLAAPREWELVLVDIDHFKRVNDTLGHVDGDDVLLRLTQVLAANKNENTLLARLGGEEFAIATRLPADNEQLVNPEALLSAIRQAPMPGGYRITASIGIARRIICEEQDWKILYRSADMALYRAKSEGRNRYVNYSADRIAA
jgi:diguanylate cyclase (GGDEF)-like protein